MQILQAFVFTMSQQLVVKFSSWTFKIAVGVILKSRNHLVQDFATRDTDASEAGTRDMDGKRGQETGEGEA
jgi:hypothetical protein